MSKKIIFILSLFALLAIFNINSIGLFIGDETKYAAGVEGLFDGMIVRGDHPLLAKTVWYFFTFTFFSLFGVDKPLFWRIGTIVFSLATLVIFYKIARMMFSKKVSLIAVLLLALDPMYFAFSRILQLEIFVTFFLLASLYYFLRRPRPPVGWISLTPVGFMGLSLASKFSALLLAIMLPVFISYPYLKRLKFYKAAKFGLAYLFVLFLSFTLGNIIFFFKKSGVNFFEYIYQLFSIQYKSPISETGFQTSSPVSWFTIPQIITLYRLNLGDYVETIVALQNPVMLLFSAVSIIATFILLVKGKIRKRFELGLVFVYFILLYIPWFFNIHTTYYYYILPSLPLLILMFVNLVVRLNYSDQILTAVLLLSIFFFFLYYPLLIGLKVPKSYEMNLYQYSQYYFPETNTVFCQNCFPRK